MPKQTFFNLTQDKKDSLLEACKFEFSRAPLHEASISNIIKRCGVSRGSFYQYFEDKEDAFYYLLKKHSEERQALFIAILKETEGDLFASITRLFEITLMELEKEDSRSYFKHVFLNMNHKIQNTFSNEQKEDTFSKYFYDIKSHINQAKLNIHNDDELYHAIHLVRMVMFNNLIRHFAKGLSKEKALADFLMEITLLQRGLSITKNDKRRIRDDERKDPTTH